MQNIFYKSAALALSASLLFSCKPSITTPSVNKGRVNATKYVAIGNSITSGFADAALYYDGQVVSYPNLLAEQFKFIGGGNFVQPLTPVGSVGIGSSLNPKLVLNYATDCKGVTSLGPKPASSAGDITIFTTGISNQGPF